MLIKNMMEDLGEGALNTDVPIPNVSTPFDLGVAQARSHLRAKPSC